MNIGPASAPRPSTQAQVEPGEVRAAQAQRTPAAGTSSNAENKPATAERTATPVPQDEVKVQWDTSDQTVVYQFVNQQGSLVLQVPSEQMLNLARQISQELVQEAAPKEPAGTEGEKSDGR
jgi:hypothetical protein